MATLRQLQYLVAIVEEGSFTRAASRLFITQPGLSHQFQALEKEVGGPLLERLPRSVRLTPAGRAMLPLARAAIAQADRAISIAQRTTDVGAGELHLATLYAISIGLLPSALRRWRASHPGVRVRLIEHRRAEDLLTTMHNGEADVAVGPPPAEWDGPIRPIGVEEFVIVTHHDDPLAAQDPAHVRLPDFANREWVHYISPSGLADVLDAACGRAGFRPKVAVRTEQGPSAANYAAAGLGPTLVPANIIPQHFEGVVLRPDPPVTRELVAYTRTEPDPVTAAFIDTVSDGALRMPVHLRRLLRLGEPESGDTIVVDWTTS